ncbi:lipopolysaccharide core heptose(I) kinase RfaP [Azoarcus taiwanensis]|uniref:Lipopolysaccharide core heptose(I) kinase n=1 Tax=Azoarcus taiwanensis TaxID=666964 RepID=A0A972J9L2_9RHOO|nr:lipopolysaccharide core heptose(I) kinase RfaP [Azoarcus taiwanensis]NMG03085.1 lipopolysaccharide core heptose(I) kinase RfaP [Azoarcus taiwanensis]
MRAVVLRPPFDGKWSAGDPFDHAARLAAGANADQIRRDVEGRRTLRFELDDCGYYLKWQKGIGWGRIVGEVLRGRRPVLGAGDEWRAIEACHALGVPTMNALAYGERGSGWAYRESFLVTEAIEPAIDLDSYTREWAQNPPAPALKHALIRAVADIASTMHRNGLNHRDFYLCHFLLRTKPEPTPGELRLAIIDLHRVQIRKAPPPRWRDKDLAALYFSALKIGLTTRDRLRFIRTYFRQPLRIVLRDEASTLAYLQRESIRLAERFERKFAHRPDLQR